MSSVCETTDAMIERLGGSALERVQWRITLRQIRHFCACPCVTVSLRRETGPEAGRPSQECGLCAGLGVQEKMRLMG